MTVPRTQANSFGEYPEAASAQMLPPKAAHESFAFARGRDTNVSSFFDPRRDQARGAAYLVQELLTRLRQEEARLRAFLDRNLGIDEAVAERDAIMGLLSGFDQLRKQPQIASPHPPPLKITARLVLCLHCHRS